MNKISAEVFHAFCTSGQMYEGEVEGLGYVSWIPRYKSSFDSGLPSQTSYNTPQNAKFVLDYYEMVVTKKSNNPEQESKGIKILTDIGVNAVTLYSIGKTYESMSNIPVVQGPDYVQVNRGGTVVRNPNKTFTTKGKIAAKVGKKLFVFSLLIDPALAFMGYQSWEKAITNMVVNTGIFLVGCVSAPLGVVLGVGWLMKNDGHKTNPGTYEEIHGTICPPDNTAVVHSNILYTKIRRRK